MSKLFRVSNLLTIVFAVLTLILAVGLIACYSNRGWLTIGTAANLSQIFGSIAVGLSLLFIATQLKLQTNLARASNSQSFVNASSSFVLAIGGDAELMKLYDTGGEGYESLGTEKQVQFRYLVGWWLTFYENVVYQHGCDLLDDGVHDAWMKDMKGFIRRRRVDKVWPELIGNYSDEFISQFAPLIKDFSKELLALSSSSADTDAGARAQ